VIAVLRALPDMARVSFAGIVAYRAEMTIWILSATMPLIMLALWNAVASEGPVAGLGQVELARYFTATLLVRQLSSVWLVWELNWEVRSGTLSTKLLKPMHPLWQYAVEMVVALPYRVVVLLPILGLLLLWRPELWLTPSPTRLLLFVASMTLAWALSFLIQAVFATLAFWVDKSEALFGVWFSVWMVLSGYVAPMATFPDWARVASTWLPFRGMLAAPVEILGGFSDLRQALLDVAVQLGWVLALLLLVSVLWRAGVRRYGAFGA
jgi:ABC-2 type transport system permease protein